MATTRTQIEAALRGSFVFPLLAPAERDRFIAAARPRSWRAGAPIFRMGEAGTAMMLVQTGAVAISYPAPDGRVVALADLQPGAMFGEIALLDGGERSADATAATDCTLLVFERAEFVAMLRQNWPLAEAVLQLLCARLRRADARMADLAFFDLPVRLARILLARARPAPGGGAPRVSDTQGALAALAGGSRETVNRHLRRWQQDGIVAIAGGRITLLDPASLARIAG